MGLADEQVTAVVENYGKNYVAKSQFNQKNDELKQVKGEVDILKGEIDGLKKSNKEDEALVAQIDKIKTDAKAHDDEYNANLKKCKLIVLYFLLTISYRFCYTGGKRRCSS